MALEQSKLISSVSFCFVRAEIIMLAISTGTWWTVTGSNSGRNMWDMIVGINTRWVTRMSTQDQLITLVFSEVRQMTHHLSRPSVTISSILCIYCVTFGFVFIVLEVATKSSEEKGTKINIVD